MSKSKVFGIGLSRTGTNSLTQALQILGLSTAHFPTDYRHIYRYDAATDSPVALAFQVLDIMFPSSKFILTLRSDREQWLLSMRFLFEILPQKWDIQTVHPRMSIPKLHRALYHTYLDWNPLQLSQAYDDHIERVRSYFRQRPDDLLEIDIPSGQGWDILCPFLHKLAPDQPFPNFAHLVRPRHDR